MASLHKFFPVRELGGEMEVELGGEGEGEGGGKSNKRLSVERIYQRKTQLEHILLRPDTYVGSTEETTEVLFVYDVDREAIVKRSVTFVPGLYKIYDEILVNAADNKQRDANMKALKIVIDPEQNLISVWNGGRGIPVEMHTTEKMYVPELIFGTLLTSSNYDDEQKKVTGGRNGYGAKLCNIFSTEFTVETASKESGKTYRQTWKNNMGAAGKAKVTSGSSDFTKVTFKPDLAKFKMTHLDTDTVALMTRRAYDLAGCTKGVAVHLNGTRLPVKGFKDYVELYVKGDLSQTEEELPRKVVYEAVNPRWEVAVTASNHGFQQASFVNSIATAKGGTHVNYIVDQLVSKLLEAAKKKNKGGMDLKPFHIKGHLWVFVNCLVENPTFDSQTKETMTLKVKSFGSTCSLSEKFIKQALSCGVVERVLSWARVKSQDKLAQKQKGSKQNKLRGIPKLDDANEAGGRHSHDCTLILTEGDSAKTLAVSGLGVVGRDHYGVFPLRGKLLNVREASHNQLMNNEEITNIVKILGLHYTKKYTDSTELRSLRYGKLLIMTDQDQDGSHIKGLVINFFHHNWPGLLRHSFVQQFITPIVKVSKGQREHAFYSLPEFEQWHRTTDGAHTWKVKYYKGLGTSTAKEAKEYFSDMERHRIPFKYGGADDDDAILLAFSKKCIERRKEWLTQWLQHRREQRDQGLNESLLYAERMDHISYSDFVNKELILFSNMDNERSIASSVDGLKPGQRKVLFTCFKRNDKREIKVAQLAGSVGEHSAYHHGEQSLMSTIVNLAQNFIGSNNINLLQPRGQFGTRLHGGKDAASARYIFTLLSPLARLLFPVNDDPQLNTLKEDNLKIEPEWYCPILPMVLVNGCDGIGTGYSTFVPNFNTREIVDNLRRLMNGLEPMEMQPWYKNFTSTIAHVEPQKYIAYGSIGRLGPTSLEITELPIRTWTQVYKENVLEPMLHGTEKIPPFITDYKEYHTDTTVRFVVYLTADKMAEAQQIGFHKKFKLETSLNTSNLVLFDHNGCLKKYNSVMEILQEFFEVRLTMYRKRKAYLEGMLTAESAKLDSQARFIMEIIEKKLVIDNKKKVVVVKLLQSRGYPSDPVKKWKRSVSDDIEEAEGEGEGEGEEVEEDADYNYLLSMSLWSLTLEKKEEILKKRDEKAQELKVLQGKTPKNLWSEDIDVFMEELDRVEEQEKAEEAAGARITKKKTKGKQGRQTKLAGGATDSGNSLKETRPSSFAEVVPPIIPEYSTEKKVAGRGRGKVKSEPKSAAGEETGAGKDDPKQKKLTFESSGETKEETKSKKADSKPKKEPAEKPSQSRKRKVKEVVDSFIVSSESEVEEEEEEAEVPKKSLRERVELRKTKTTDYKDVFSGDDSVESEASWRSGGEDVEIEASPPMKKAKLAAGGPRTADATGEGVKNQAKLDSGKNTEPKAETKSNKPALEGAEPKGPGKRKREAKTATAKPVAKTTAKQTAKQAAKPSTKTVGGGKSTGSSSSGSSGEKKVAVKDVFSGDDSVESEASWRSGGEDVEIEASPPMKKAKLAAGGSRTADATGEGVKNQAKLDSGKNIEPMAESKSKAALEGAEPKGPGKRKREAKTATAKPVAKTTAKQTAKQAAKPSTKTVGGGKSTGSSSSGSSGEKKKGKVAVGKKRVVSHDFVSDDELDCNIESGSESDSFVVPAKKVATEAGVSRPQRGQRVQYNIISDDSDDSDFMP